jgi:hypothetical protein
LVFLRTFFLILTVLFQCLTTSGQIHFNEEGKVYSSSSHDKNSDHSHSTELNHDEKQVSDSNQDNIDCTEKTTSHQEDSHSGDCCHIHCCSFGLAISDSLFDGFEIQLDSLFILKQVRLINYHSSIYRPPIV